MKNTPRISYDKTKHPTSDGPPFWIGNDNKLYEEAIKNYLRSIKEFDTKYLGSLNIVIPSKDFLEYTRNYKVPYWANSLNIYCKA